MTPWLEVIRGSHGAQSTPLSLKRKIEGLAGMTMLRRAPALAFVAETAAFLASDGAAAITGTITNVTCGLVAG